MKGAIKPKLIFHLSYQSRVGPVKWLSPYTDNKIKELGILGVKNLAVVPISFVSEHIETLEEIDNEYRKLAIEENGIINWKRVEAPNTNPLFIEELATMVVSILSFFLRSLSFCLTLRFLLLFLVSRRLMPSIPQVFLLRKRCQCWYHNNQRRQNHLLSL
jgi:hypothetical protein